MKEQKKDVMNKLGLFLAVDIRTRLKNYCGCWGRIWEHDIEVALGRLYHFQKEDIPFVINCLIALGKIEYKLTDRRHRLFVVK